MAQYSIHVTGLREVVRSLNQFKQATEDLKDANNAIGSKVSRDAVATAPKLTGALAGSIRPNRAKNNIQIKAGGAKVPYAGVIEYGYPTRGIEAQPFLRRAAWDNMGYVKEEYARNIQGLVQKYIGVN